MKKKLKVFVLLTFGVFVVMQFFVIDKNNPPVVDADTLESAVAVPTDVQNILLRSCSDCHSNRTVYPWYSNIAPVSWFLKKDIDEGRQRLNFSVFNTYDAKKKVRRLEQICEMVQSKEMPLPTYLWMHPNAVITEDQSKVLCEWSRVEVEKIVGDVE